MVLLATLALAVSQTFSSPIANPEAEAQIGPEPVGPVIIDEVSSIFVKMYSLVNWSSNTKTKNEFQIQIGPEPVGPVIIDEVHKLNFH